MILDAILLLHLGLSTNFILDFGEATYKLVSPFSVLEKLQCLVKAKMDQIFKTKITCKMDQPLCSPSPFSVDDVKYFISRKTSKYDIRLVNG